MAQLNFDATAIKPATLTAGMLPISGNEGWPVVVIASEMKPTQSGDGAFLALTLQICEGEHEGEMGTHRLNLVNPNDKAVEIAQRELSAICYVTGVVRVSDSSELHGIPFRVIVSPKKKKDPSEPDYTEIKGFKDIDGNNPGEKTVAVSPKGKPAFSPGVTTPAMAQEPAPTPVQASAPAPAPATAPAWQDNAAPAETAPSMGKPAWAK